MKNSQFVAIISMTFMAIGASLMIAVTAYLNRSKRRRRFFELTYSEKNEWGRGKKIDFFSANFMASNAVYIALMFKCGLAHSRSKDKGFSLVPNLHNNKNYLALLHEFKFFVALELFKIFTITLGLIGSLVFEVMN